MHPRATWGRYYDAHSPVATHCISYLVLYSQSENLWLKIAAYRFSRVMNGSVDLGWAGLGLSQNDLLMCPLSANWSAGGWLL